MKKQNADSGVCFLARNLLRLLKVHAKEILLQEMLNFDPGKYTVIRFG